MSLLPVDGRGAPPERKIAHRKPDAPPKPPSAAPGAAPHSFTPAPKMKPPLVLIPGKWHDPESISPDEAGFDAALRAVAVLLLCSEGAVTFEHLEEMLRDCIDLTVAEPISGPAYSGR